MTKYMTLKTKLSKAFKALRKQGIYAEADSMCCNSCALSIIPDEVINFVFYHAQNRREMKGGSCYLGWGGDAASIITELILVGLLVEWDGTTATKILVKLEGK